MPKFEFEKDGKRWEVEAPDQAKAIAAWSSQHGQQGGGSTMGDFGRGMGQGLGRAALDVGRVITPGGPAAADLIGRTLREHDPTGASQAVSKFLDEPSKSKAQTAGQFTGGFVPALIPGPQEASILGPAFARSAIPLAKLAIYAAAHKLGPAGRAGYHMAHRHGLTELAARWLASHVGSVMDDLGRGVERVGAGAGEGTRATKGKRDEEKSGRDTREPPAKAGRPPAGRPREADDRNNRSPAPQRFDRRWASPGDFQSTKSTERETR